MSKSRKRGIQQQNFDLVAVAPRTENQRKVFNAKGHLVLHGVAGTGKTFLSLYLGLKHLFNGDYDKIVLIRSAVPTRDIGFLPGNDRDKAEIYESPYRDVCEELLERGDAYQILKAQNQLEFRTTSFIRGTTIRNSVIVVDECQNMTMHELDSIITRVGDNCRIIFSGDFRQSDLKSNGLNQFFTILRNMGEFEYIDFSVDDILISGLVKNYIKAKTEYESSFK